MFLYTRYPRMIFDLNLFLFKSRSFIIFFQTFQPPLIQQLLLVKRLIIKIQQQQIFSMEVSDVTTVTSFITLSFYSIHLTELKKQKEQVYCIVIFVNILKLCEITFFILWN